MKNINAAKEEGLRAASAFIEAFREAILESREELASTRCIAHSALSKLVATAHETIDTSALSEASGTQLIRLLQDAGVVRPIPLEGATAMKKVRLYAVGFDTDGSALPPGELLQAYLPEGILCYFTALELHGLTTQAAPHYHIATLKRTPTPPSPSTLYNSGRSDKAPPLGSAQFFSEGIGYYLTRRDPKNLIGLQRRQINPFCIVKVTTLEQTLIDCLHRPRNAGGAAVVFEAWREGILRTDPQKLLDLALQIGDPILARRVGYMVERFAPDFPIAPLRKIAEMGSAPDQLPSLLAGIPYERINSRWGLRTP